MTTKNSSTAILPPVRVQDVDQQIRSLVGSTYQWVGTHWLQIIIAIGVASAIVVGLHFVRRLARNHRERRTGPTNWKTTLYKAVVKTGNIFMIMLAAKIVATANFAGTPPEVTATIDFLWTLAAWFQVAIWARELILGGIENRAHSEHYSGEAIGSAMSIIRLLVTFAVFAIAFVVVLDNIGVNVTGLVAGLGVGGIAIGLAAQGVFADLFAALAIIFDKPFSRGDSISYDGTSGSVEEIGLKSTRIRSITGEQRIIANKQLLEKEIQNNTRRTSRRVKFAIGTIYQTPPDVLLQIPGILEDVAEANGATFVRSGFIGFGDSSLNFEMEFDCPADFQAAYDLRNAVGIAVLKRFNDEGIEFAYPTQTSFTSAPDGKMIMPYPAIQPVKRVDLKDGEK